MSHHVRLVARAVGAVDNSRTVSFVLSTSAEDRAGDTIDQNGWMLDSYKANPVVLWAHNSSAPPIGRCSNLRLTNRGLEADVTFATAEEYAFADTVFKLVKGRFINAGSVGFMAHKYSARYDDKSNFQGISFEQQELTEFSICPVPMNSEALCVARSFGADETALSTIVDLETDYRALRASLGGDVQRAVKAAHARARARAALSASKAKLIHV